jgi:hypothetical protein
MKLLNQRFLVVMLKSSLQVLRSPPRLNRRNHIPVLPSFLSPGLFRRPTIVRKQIVLLKFNCNSLLKEKFEWVFRSRKSNDRQYNDQKKKSTSSDLQNTTQKTKHSATQTALKIGGELMCSGRIGRSCFACSTRRVTLWTNLVIRMREGPECDYDD